MSKSYYQNDEDFKRKTAKDLDLLADSMESNSPMLYESKRGKTINAPVQNLRMFEEDSVGDIVMSKPQKAKMQRAENLKKPGGVESDAMT